MSTRGLFMWQINGKKHGYFNHWDSYPSSLGNDLVAVISGSTPEKLKDALSKATAVADCAGEDAIEFLQSCLNDREVKYIDSIDFLEDTLFCEWAYCVNLDDGSFDIYDSGEFIVSMDLNGLDGSFNKWLSKRTK